MSSSLELQIARQTLFTDRCLALVRTAIVYVDMSNVKNFGVRLYAYSHYSWLYCPTVKCYASCWNQFVNKWWRSIRMLEHQSSNHGTIKWGHSSMVCGIYTRALWFCGTKRRGVGEGGPLLGAASRLTSFCPPSPIFFSGGLLILILYICIYYCM